MFALNTLTSVPSLNLLTMSTIIEANGPVFNGPGANKPNTPFSLCTLELNQRDAIERAKKYAMEQSIRSVLLRQTQSQQSLQLNNIKKNQTVALLNRVYVGSIAYDVKEESLRQIFSPFGPIKSVNLSWDPATQKHKGFAFLEYEYPEAAQLAIDQMNGTSFGGRQLKVGRPSNLTNAEPVIADLVAEHKLQNRIYVSGIHLDLTEDDVSLVFEAFGKIVFCRLQPDPSRPGYHRGFGYIEYETMQSAADAVGSMNQFNLGGQLLRVCKAISPPDGITSATSSNLPPAAAVAAASATAKVLSMETEQLPVNSSPGQLTANQMLMMKTMPTNNHPPATSETYGSNTGNPGLYQPGQLAGTLMLNTAQPADQQQQQQQLQQPPTMTETSPKEDDDFNAHSNGFSNNSLQSPGPNAEPWQVGSNNGQPATPVASSPLTVQQLSSVPSNSVSTTMAAHQDPSTMPINFSVLILRNMVGPEDCDDELEGEVASECSKYGPVQQVLIHQDQARDTGAVIVNIFVVFEGYGSVQNAVTALNGRYFAGRQITAEPYDVRAFLSHNFSL